MHCSSFDDGTYTSADSLIVHPRPHYSDAEDAVEMDMDDTWVVR